MNFNYLSFSDLGLMPWYNYFYHLIKPLSSMPVHKRRIDKVTAEYKYVFISEDIRIKVPGETAK